jgi:hypothetical protein
MSVLKGRVGEETKKEAANLIMTCSSQNVLNSTVFTFPLKKTQLWQRVSEQNVL